MKRSFALILFFCLFCLTAARGETIDLPVSDWKAVGAQAVLGVEGAALKLVSGGGWAGVYNQKMAGALLDENNLLSFEMKCASGGIATVFWANYLDQRFLPQRSYQFYLGGPGRWHRYYIDLAVQEKDLTRLDNILINALTGPGEAEIRDIRIEKGTTSGKLLAGWQEFLGPRGREVVGYTINTMPSVRLFGREFLVYLYWLIALACVVLLAAEFWPVWRRPEAGKKKKAADLRPKFEPAFGRAVKKILIFVFGLWVLLEASSLYTDWRNLRGDLPLLGKDLETKRALVNTGDFYSFVRFCQEKLPAGAAFDMSIPPVYNDIKAVYYLYPRQLAAGAPFLIVYDQQVSPETSRRYAPFALFRPNAYIMKRVAE